MFPSLNLVTLRPMKRGLLLAGLGCAMLAASASAQDYFVSVSGSNSAAGTHAAPWRTITFAAKTAPSGSRIHIGPGTYGQSPHTEGFEVKDARRLEFQGAGIGKTILVGNAAFKKSIPYLGGSKLWTAPILIHGVGTKVSISHLTIDASNLTSASLLSCAVYSGGASGTLDRVEMKNAGTNPANGAQGHIGFLAAGTNTSTPSTVTVSHCIVRGWNKSGIVMRGKGLSGVIHNCEIYGAGRLGAGKAAQNAIDVGDGGSFIVRDNLVRDVWYTPNAWNAVGILCYDVSGSSVVRGNRILNCKTALYYYTTMSGSTSFNANRIANCDWGASIESSGASASGNYFGANTSVYVGPSSSFSISGNHYSDFRGNAGYPSKYVANGNTAVQDTSPAKGVLGFESAVTVSQGPGSGPNSVVTGDFNGDNKPDFAVANSGTNRVVVHFGSGGTNFTTIASKSVNVPGGPSYLTTGEFSGTSGLDLAVACADGRIYVLWNNGSGTFTKGAPFDLDGSANNSQPTSIASAQLNAADQDDLLIGYAGDFITINGGIKVLTVKNGALTSAASPAGTLRSVQGVTIADLNKDNRADLLVVDQSNKLGSSDKLHVYLHSTSAYGFVARSSYSIGSQGSSVAAGDLNVDGKLDAVVTCASNPGRVHVFLGTGTSGALSESSKSPFFVANDAQSVALVDLQDDADFDTNRMDVVIAHPSENRLTRLRSFDGNGFADVRAGATGLDPRSIAFAKLNAKALPDILVAHRGDAQVAVALAKPDALSQDYGKGCPGFDGKFPILYAEGSPARPVLANPSFKLSIHQSRELSVGVMLIASQQTPSATPCSLQVLGLFWLPAFLTDSFGRGDVPFPPIPNDTNLIGSDFFCQGLVFDSSGGFLSVFSLSQGMRFRFGF